jgi:ubiquinone/menaquinone biosynthesis C-methylase UbiE
MGLDVHSPLSSNYRKHTAANPVQRALIDRFHRKIVTEVVALSPQTFLDAGCGEGFVAQRVIDAVPGIDLTGCDVSDAALEMAADANPGARFVVGSVVELPFPDRSFDVVGCFEVLEHLPGELPRRALSELARGKNLDVRPRGSDPDHKQFWSRSAFGELVGEQFVVAKLAGSFPWTICVATVPSR